LIRIRLGDSWRHDPTFLRGLRSLGEQQGAGFSPRDVVDALRIEVDEIDLTRGRAEVSLLDALVALRAATSGEPQAIALGPTIVLHTEPLGDELQLRLASEQGVVRATIDAMDFTEAVRGAAGEFVHALGQVNPSLKDHRLCRTLLGQPPLRAARPPKELRPAPPPKAVVPQPPEEVEPPRPRLALPAEGLRRLLYRRQWQSTTTAGATVEAFGKGLLFRGPHRVQWRLSGSEAGWSARLSRSWVTAGKKPLVFGWSEEKRLVALDVGGVEQLRLPGAPEGSVRFVGQDRLLLATADRLLCLGFDGSTLWAQPLPERLFRAVPLSGERAALLTPTEVTALSLQDGSSGWQTAFALGTVIDAAAWGTHLCVGVDDQLALLSASTGSIRWQITATGTGRVSPVITHGAIWVARHGAAFSRFDRGGTETAAGPLDSDPSLSPTTPVPLQVSGTLGLLMGARTHVIDLRSGRAVASLEGSELVPRSAALLPNGQVITVNHDGLVEGWTANGYLHVPAARAPDEKDRAALC
jgi:hypothetical protein